MIWHLQGCCGVARGQWLQLYNTSAGVAKCGCICAGASFGQPSLQPLLVLLVDSSHVYAQETMVEAVEARGFEAHLLGAEGSSVLRLHVGGMTCSHCSDSIQQALSLHPGITKVDVSALTNHAEVSHDLAHLGGACGQAMALIDARLYSET